MQIRKMLNTSNNRIRRYAKGDPLAMCRYSQFGRSKLDAYRTEIIESLKANLTKKDILMKLTALGHTGKKSSLLNYCRKVIDELQIPYAPRKNMVGVTVKTNQKMEVHYVTSHDVLKHLWSGKELDKADTDYLFNKFPALTELKLCISHFREIYAEKNTSILDWFIAIYAQSSYKSIASFASGLMPDIDAVNNSVTCSLSNGFVEGIINKIKVIKRIMYGRAKIQLLSAKVVHQSHDT